MAEIETITVSLLGKKYQVSCEEEEVEILEKSAKYLNKKMGEIRDSGRAGFGQDSRNGGVEYHRRIDHFR